MDPLAYESDLHASDNVVLPYRPLGPRIVVTTIIFGLGVKLLWATARLSWQVIAEGHWVLFTLALPGLLLLALIPCVAVQHMIALVRRGRTPIMLSIVKGHLLVADPDVYPTHRDSIPVNEVASIAVSEQRRERVFWRYEFTITVQLTNGRKRLLEIQTYDPAARKDAVDQIRQKLADIPFVSTLFPSTGTPGEG